MQLLIYIGIVCAFTILIFQSVNGIPKPAEQFVSEIHDVQVSPGGNISESQYQEAAPNCNCPTLNINPEKPTVVIFLSSVRKQRVSTRMGKFVEKAVEASGMHGIILDPAEIPFEMLREPLQSIKNPETNAPVWLREANKTIALANAFIIVSTEYNGEIPPAMTNMLDHFPFETFANRPTGIVTYSTGMLGGARVSVVLRPFLSNLGMITLPTYVAVRKVKEVIDENGNCSEIKLSNDLDQLVTEIKWFCNALDFYRRNFNILQASPVYM